VTEFDREFQEKFLSRKTILVESLEHDLILVRSTGRGKHPRWLEVDGFRFTPLQLDYLRAVTKEGLTRKEAAIRLGKKPRSATKLLRKLRESNSSENGALPTKKELAERASGLGLFNESSLVKLKDIFK
jgi:hypothetical protein